MILYKFSLIWIVWLIIFSTEPSLPLCVIVVWGSN